MIKKQQTNAEKLLKYNYYFLAFLTVVIIWTLLCFIQTYMSNSYISMSIQIACLIINTCFVFKSFKRIKYLKNYIEEEKLKEQNFNNDNSQINEMLKVTR